MSIVRTLANDVLICLEFYSRLRVPNWVFNREGFDAASLGRAARLAPLAGAVIGAIAAGSLLIFAVALGLPTWVATVLALATGIACSGAMHEDGLADLADGFGGGSTIQRKLDIMRDSRIGTFGALALVLSVLVRAGSCVALIDRYGLGAGALVLIAIGAVSRGFGLLPLAILPPARADGLARSVGTLPRGTLPCALVLASAIGALCSASAGIGFWHGLVACAAAGTTSLWMTRLARRQIGGQTGDVSGAAQQVCEIAFLLALLVSPRLG